VNTQIVSSLAARCSVLEKLVAKAARRIGELDELVRERKTRILQLDTERKRHKRFWTWKLLQIESWLRRRVTGGSQPPQISRGLF
jgi:hypothetical protein